jgi:hypothetical protein
MGRNISSSAGAKARAAGPARANFKKSLLFTGSS